MRSHTQNGGVVNECWQLWDRKTVARIWGVSVRQVQKWEGQGRLSPTKCDGDRIVRYSSQIVVADIVRHTLLSRGRPQTQVGMLPVLQLDPEQFDRLCERLERIARVLGGSAVESEAA